MSEEQVARVVAAASQVVACAVCETRLRFGNRECPHCGADVEEVLRAWARRLLAALADSQAP